MRLAMCAPVPYARPTSVENERKKRVVSWWKNRVGVVLVLVAGYWGAKYLGWELPRLG